MERKVVIVHHNDMDGIFSGAIIYDYEKNINKTNWIKCIKVDYTMDLQEAIGEGSAKYEAQLKDLFELLIKQGYIANDEN